MASQASRTGQDSPAGSKEKLASSAAHESKTATDLEETDPDEFQRRIEKKLAELTLNEEDRRELERCTKQDRSAWLKARKGRITDSVFQDVSNMRQDTSSAKLLDKLLHDADPNLKSWDGECEVSYKEQAVRAYEQKFNCSVRRPVGLMVHPELGFIGTTPSGIVSDDLILKVACPRKPRCEDASLKSMAGNENFYLDINMKLKRSHHYYSQVQAQMACCGARYCDFFVWAPGENDCQQIKFDPDYWKEKLDIVSKFYFECVLPEMVDSRKARGLPYRERNE